MYTAHVNFYKDIEKDNWHTGCEGLKQSSYFEKFTVDFTDKDDLLEELADYITAHFDVYHDEFIEYVNNECDNNRFDYSQNEDDDGNRIDLKETNPDGWLAYYQFLITKVTQEVEYKFD